MATTKSPRKVRAPGGMSTAGVARLLQADLDAAKTKAKARAEERVAAKEAKIVAKAAAQVQAAAEQRARDAENAANALLTAKVDADALGKPFEEVCADMGIDPKTGYPDRAKTPYQGPMLALKSARVTYVKAKNGILCNGDKLATLCGAYSREDVDAALIDALKLPGNPYLQLNPGQQSMNLRNKARHAVSNGFVSLGEIEGHLKAHAAKTQPAAA